MACGSKAALRTLRPLRGIVNADHNRKYHFVAVESHDDGFVERVIDFPLAENVGISEKYVKEEVQCVSMEKRTVVPGGDEDGDDAFPMACGSKAALRTLRPLRGIVDTDHNRKYRFVAVESNDDGFVERVIYFPLAENVGIAGKFVPDPVISRTS